MQSSLGKYSLRNDYALDIRENLQVVESLPYNEKVDVYAFGLLLWEMLEDRRVFDGMGVSDFYERVVNAGARPNLDPAWPQVTSEFTNFGGQRISRTNRLSSRVFLWSKPTDISGGAGDSGGSPQMGSFYILFFARARSCPN